MSAPTPTSEKRVQRLRDMVEEAKRDGVDAEAILLRLTLGDAAELKRAPTVAVHEISFASGEMRFLGVRVTQGGVTTSSLDRNAKA